MTDDDPIEGAWKHYTAAEKRAMIKQGVTVIHIPHQQYVDEYMPKMRGDYTCPHRLV